MLSIEQRIAHDIAAKTEQVRAMKFIAFSNCLKERYALCRAEFIKIYGVNPDFDLTPAEAGHPSWTKTFAAAKAQAKKELAERAARDAKEKAAKDKAAADTTKAQLTKAEDRVVTRYIAEMKAKGVAVNPQLPVGTAPAPDASKSLSAQPEKAGAHSPPNK